MIRRRSGSRPNSSNARKAVGVDATAVKVRGGLHRIYQDPIPEKRSLFEFFVGKQRAQQPRARLRWFTAPSGRHSRLRYWLWKAQSVRPPIEPWCTAWRQVYFCRLPDEEGLAGKDADIKKYDLALVGDNVTNSVVLRMDDRLPTAHHCYRHFI
jgi:hypothetical protein